MLKAARELFTRKGYEATTTKEIAIAAGVQEPLLFTNFSSKAGLFEAAVISPFSDLVTDYAEYWINGNGDLAPEERIARFIDSFYDLAVRNRSLLLAALSQGESADAKSGYDIFTRLAKILHRIEGIEALSSKYPDIDGPAVVTAVAGMIFGAALLDDRLSPPIGPKVTRARISAEMVKTVLYGTFGRSASSAKK